MRSALVLAVGAVAALAPVAPQAQAATVDTTATYAVVARHSGKAMQVQSTADGGAVVQSTRVDSAAQQFQFVDSGGGYYRLKSRYSGKVVDVSGSSTANGADVVQWTDKNAANQQFSLVDTDSGYVRIVNRNSGKALDVWERSTADGARVSQYDVNGGTNQQWQLVRLGGGDTPGGNGSPTDPNVKYFGRWNTADPTAYVSEWAGAYLVVGFTGRTVQLRQRNTIDFFVSIDGGPDVAYVNRSGTVNLTPTPLAAGNHTLRVSYRPVAGSYRGDAVYRGIQLDAGATTFAPPVPAKTVEFVGDSITVGQQSSKQALTAYGWLVGERLGTGHTQIAVGGACLVSAADGCIGMSDRFLKTGITNNTDWNFSRYTANVVVINLGTNDVGHSVSGAQFQSAYVTLIQRARQKYPDATILAMQTFRKRYIPETQAAVRLANDPKVRFVDTTGWIVESTDTTDNVHPNDQGHRKIADRLAPIVSAALAG
ncbi:RICIN domain-containing protein [Saccharothrix sp. S26]|uniref:RICIN domain-containing protein n=1 Tax=Saccharothrix sp. S26 TaxID=2907215 RepID=UPI001F19598E|nr:RICIN domain-containing protein [Saccharothrix sp. S26]MCE6998685.1 RICIN domain-containing protein [Saccharothrix sp. S26]